MLAAPAGAEPCVHGRRTTISMTTPHTQLQAHGAADPQAEMAAVAGAAGLRRVHVLSWRDLEHPWAGGSELHINEVARCWAAAGIDVIIRTGAVAGQPAVIERDGYRVVRSGGRVTVLAQAPAARWRRRLGPHDGLVEVWHGVNFLAPLWARGPRISVVHHVHGPQFREVLPRGPAEVAMLLERAVYPRLYRASRLVAVSASTRRSLVALGYPAEHVDVAENGVAERFTPGGPKSPTPLVLAVARLMPQKRVPLLVEVLAEVRHRVPALRAVIVGDGPDRPRVEDRVRALGCSGWLELAGRVDDDELLRLYREAWVLASASSAEGWGLTITEAAACGTPAVATRIPGHEDAVLDGVSGLLASDPCAFADQLSAVLCDGALRARLAHGALERVAGLRWSQTALRLLRILAAEVAAHRSR